MTKANENSTRGNSLLED